MYYLEIRDRRGGLLIKVVSPLVTECTFSANKAMNFEKRNQARNFLNENNLKDQFKAIKIN